MDQAPLNPEPSDAGIEFGPYRLFPRLKLMLHGGEKIKLTERAFDVPISISALPWIVDKGLRRSWTMDVISATEPARSSKIILTFIPSPLLLAALHRLGEAFPEKRKQFGLGKKSGLLTRIDLLNRARQPAAFTSL